MSKTPLPLYVGDISGLARSLGRQLKERETAPGHVELLNLLAKAGGFRNFQHFRAQTEARQALDAPLTPAPEVDYALVKRLTRFFDAKGRLIRWPKKHSQRMICLWAMWSRIPAATGLNEREISELLDSWHLFGDFALLRRELADHGLVSRTPDGREYKRRELPPPAEALALFSRLRSRPA